MRRGGKPQRACRERVVVVVLVERGRRRERIDRLRGEKQEGKGGCGSERRAECNKVQECKRQGSRTGQQRQRAEGRGTCGERAAEIKTRVPPSLVLG